MSTNSLSTFFVFSMSLDCKSRTFVVAPFFLCTGRNSKARPKISSHKFMRLTKSITEKEIVVVFFASRGPQSYIVSNPRQQFPLLLYSRRNFLCSQTLSINLQHSSKCQPFPATPSFPRPCLSQSATEHQYALSSNDKMASLARI